MAHHIIRESYQNLIVRIYLSKRKSYRYTDLVPVAFVYGKVWWEVERREREWQRWWDVYRFNTNVPTLRRPTHLPSQCTPNYLLHIFNTLYTFISNSFNSHHHFLFVNPNKTNSSGPNFLLIFFIYFLLNIKNTLYYYFKNLFKIF